MALNWYLTLRNLSKTDATALELFETLKKAETDEEKESAKQKAQDYIAQINSNSGSVDNPETESSSAEEETALEETDTTDSGCDTVDCPDNSVSDDEHIILESSETDKKADETDETDEEKIKTDLSLPAFNPRLAKCGITREEELFLNHVFVRKLSHEEKILMRRSIYQKKTLRNAKIQAEFKAKRLAQRQKDLNDPEKIKQKQEKKFISSVVDALENHRNLKWIFSQIDGLTPDVLRDLLQHPENVNAIKQVNPDFIENFNKKYGV